MPYAPTQSSWEANGLVSPLGYGIVRGIHDLATAAWIGGLIGMVTVTLPALRSVLGKGPEMNRLVAAIQSRLAVLVHVSIALLIVTGLIEARQAEQFLGLLRFANPYSTALGVKHLMVLMMIVIAFYRSRALGAGRVSGDPARQRLSLALLMANLVLGVAVVLLSGVTAALSQ